MADASVTLRDATEDDVAFCAEIQLSASRSHLPRGIWEYLYDFDREQTLHLLEHMAVAEPVNFCHWSLFQVAEVDGVPAAAMCGFDPATQGMTALQAATPDALAAAKIEIDDLTEFLERLSILGSVTPEHEKGSWVIENVATLPQFRRRGLVDLLLDATIDRGKTKGFAFSQIAVLIGNAPARNAYLKAGFEPVDEKRDARFEVALGCAGIERLFRSN